MNYDNISKSQLKCLITVKKFEKESDQPLNITEEILFSHEEEDNMPNEDLAFLANVENLNMKSYDNIKISSIPNFMEIPLKNGGTAHIKKSTILWLLNKNDSHLSVDRMMKYKTSINSSKNVTYINKQSNNEYVFVGDFICFLDQTGQFFAGQVLNFQYAEGKNSQYSLNYAPISPPTDVAPRGLLVLCTYFSIEDDKKLNMCESKGYLDMNCYYSHLNIIRDGLKLMLTQDCFEIIKKFL